MSYLAGIDASKILDTEQSQVEHMQEAAVHLKKYMDAALQVDLQLDDVKFFPTTTFDSISTREQNMSKVSFLDFVKEFGKSGDGVRVRKIFGRSNQNGQLFVNTKVDDGLVLALDGGVEFITVKEVDLKTTGHQDSPLWRMVDKSFDAWERYQAKAAGEVLMTKLEPVSRNVHVPITKVRFTGELVHYRGYKIIGMFVFCNADKTTDLPDKATGFLVTDSEVQIFVTDYDVKFYDQHGPRAHVHLVE